jgi:hypoxanthine phosphoribosyltransferase
MKILIPADAIQARLGELAGEIATAYHGKPLTIVGVLTGSLMFVADLVRRLDLPVRIAFLQASSYRGAVTTSGELHVHLELLPELSGRHVLLLDDILDTGKTLSRLIGELHKLGPASVKVGVLLRKLGRQVADVEPHYCGFEIPDAFVVGYGLDYNDEYRNLPHIAELPPQ